MAMTNVSTSTATAAPPSTGTSYGPALAVLTTLFFIWGSLTSLNDVIIPFAQNTFKVNIAESMLIQTAFFLAYFIFSIPSAKIIDWIGYKWAIIVGLGTMIAACLLFYPAAKIPSFPFFLTGFFILAAGITVLQVAANPLVAALGPPERSHFRLVFSQAFNSLGTVIAPYVGSAIMLSGGMFAAKEGVVEEAARTESLRSIDTAFFGIAGLIVLLAIFIWSFRGRIQESAPSLSSGPKTSVMATLSSPWALYGALAIFLYVGAEVSIASVFPRYAHTLKSTPELLAVGAKVYVTGIHGWVRVVSDGLTYTVTAEHPDAK